MDSNGIASTVAPFLLCSKDGLDIPIEGIAVGPLLIHESVQWPGWSVSEVETGREVLGGFARGAAASLAKSLADVWIPPESPLRHQLPLVISTVLRTRPKLVYIAKRGRFLGYLAMGDEPR